MLFLRLGLEGSDDLRFREFADLQSEQMRGQSKILSGSDSNIYGIQFPPHMRSLKDQLKEELKIATEARRRLIEGVEGSSATTSSTQSTATARTRGHVRQNSEPEVDAFSLIAEDKDIAAATTHLRNTPFKSYEYESLTKLTAGSDSIGAANFDVKRLDAKIDELELQVMPLLYVIMRNITEIILTLKLQKVRETSIDSMRDHNALEKTYKSLGLRPYHTLERDSMNNPLGPLTTGRSASAASGSALHYDPWGRDTAAHSHGGLRRLVRSICSRTICNLNCSENLNVLKMYLKILRFHFWDTLRRAESNANLDIVDLKL